MHASRQSGRMSDLVAVTIAAMVIQQVVDPLGEDGQALADRVRRIAATIEW
jgi:hypothetical protein